MKCFLNNHFIKNKIVLTSIIYIPIKIFRNLVIQYVGNEAIDGSRLQTSMYNKIAHTYYLIGDAGNSDEDKAKAPKSTSREQQKR
jgi:hypothetical protein